MPIIGLIIWLNHAYPIGLDVIGEFHCIGFDSYSSYKLILGIIKKNLMKKTLIMHKNLQTD